MDKPLSGKTAIVTGASSGIGEATARTLAGLGAAIVSSWAVADDIAAGRLVELFPQWRASPLPVHLVYPWARYYPTRLRKFLDLMREVMPQIAGMQRPEGE